MGQMTIRRPFRGAPGSGGFYRHGNSNCRLCRGDGWVPKTSRERNEDEEFEMLMELVYGPVEIVEGFGGPGRETAPPGHKMCPECHESLAENDSFFRGDRRTELKALRILAKRTERGEKFSSEKLGILGQPSKVLRNSPLPKKKVAKSKTSKQSLSEQLAQLAELREAGALTAMEFKLAKQRLLNSPKATATAPTKRKTKRTPIPEIDGFGGPGRRS